MESHSRRDRQRQRDLRGNPGGLFRQAVLMADAFLGEGKIVSLHGRTPGNQRTWQADPDELLAGVPMVVLLDGRSASASELVAAALQENGRATVMGQRSFGKGSVQTTISLGPDKGALRLTTALYHGPSGRGVQRTGVGPVIELVATPGNAAGARRREADRAQALPGADEPPPPKVAARGAQS
jgi:carboxyl-terminal processing protease